MPPALRITERKPSELKAFPGNARLHRPGQIDQLIRSIEEFGWTVPILLDERDRILAGHARWEAAKILDLKKVPTIQKTGLSMTQKRAYVIADNKLPEAAYWDNDQLAAQIEMIMKTDLDLELTGFSQAEIAFLTADQTPMEVDPPKAKTKAQRAKAESLLRCPHCGQEFEP